MTGVLNTNNNEIVNMGSPTAADNTVNKEYVENEISKVASSGTHLLDGSNKMLANIDIKQQRDR